MTVNAPSLAILLAGQDQNSLFSSINNKPAVSAKLTHQSLSSKEAEEKQAIASKSSVERQLDNFDKAVANATTLEEALSDPTVHKVLTKIYEVKILSGNSDRFANLAASDPEDSTSEAARSRDRGIIKLATDLTKSGDGLGLLKDAEYLSSLKDHLVSIEFEEKARAINPAAGDAFYFERKSAGLTRALDILADSATRDVVFGALKFPDSYKSQSLEFQIQKLDEKLDYSDFQDMDYVKSMSVDYLNGLALTQATGKPSLLSILQSSGTGSLFDVIT